RQVGVQSIVFANNAGPSPLAGGETRTRVAMGKYQTSFDTLNASITIGFDELFGFGASTRDARRYDPKQMLDGEPDTTTPTQPANPPPPPPPETAPTSGSAPESAPSTPSTSSAPSSE